MEGTEALRHRRLIFKAHRLVHQSILGWRVLQKKRKYRRAKITGCYRGTSLLENTSPVGVRYPCRVEGTWAPRRRRGCRGPRPPACRAPPAPCTCRGDNRLRALRPRRFGLSLLLAGRWQVGCTIVQIVCRMLPGSRKDARYTNSCYRVMWGVGFL